MITFEQARRIALATIGPECGLMDEHGRELPYGWYFHAQSLKYLQTGDWRYMLFGFGSFLVERDGGRVIHFYTPLDTDEHLRRYEKGYRFPLWNVTVRAVRDRAATVQLLLHMDMRYALTEFEYGRRWRIPRPYTPALLDQLLNDLPLVFSAVSLTYEAFLAAKHATCCDTEVVGVDGNDRG